MRLARRLALLVSVALLVMSLSAPGAGADALRQGGFVVPVGFVLSFTAAGGVTFNGVLPQNVQCPTSGLGGAITTNNIAAMPVRGNVATWSFGSCTEPVALSSCTVTANMLPWINGVRMNFGPPKAYTVIVPTVASITISCALPPPAGLTTCTYTGAAGIPPQEVPGGWTDATMTSPAIVRFINSPLRRIAPSAAACALAPTYTATYRANQNALTLTP